MSCALGLRAAPMIGMPQREALLPPKVAKNGFCRQRPEKG
jgi:hypothetical protein